MSGEADQDPTEAQRTVSSIEGPAVLAIRRYASAAELCRGAGGAHLVNNDAGDPLETLRVAIWLMNKESSRLEKTWELRQRQYTEQPA
jgi:hypothetical protein